MTADEIGQRLDAIYDGVTSKLCFKDPKCYKCCRGCESNNAFFESPDVPGFPGKTGWRAEFRANAKAMQLFKVIKDEYGWDPVTGFMSEQGCRLPRTVRPVYCQQVDCVVVQDMVPDKGTLIQELRALRIAAKGLI